MAWTLEELMAGEEAAARAVGEPIPRDLVPKVRAMVIAVMNRAIELRRLETIVWRQRVERAAEALADVAPGELGRLDLVGRIERLETERDEAVRLGAVGTHERDELNREIEGHGRREEAAIAALAAVGVDASLGLIQGVHAIIARLKPSGQVAEDAAEARALAMVYCGDHCAEDGCDDDRHTERCVDARSAITNLATGAQLHQGVTQENEFLRGRLAQIDGQRVAAEKEAEALRAKMAKVEKERDAIREKAVAGGERWQGQVDELRARVAELEAAESRLAAIRERGKDNVRLLGLMNLDHNDELTVVGLGRTLRWVLEGDAPQEAKCSCEPPFHVCDRSVATRFPCSPTCTHDDAATPGHPERVMQRSEAVKEATDPVGALAKEAGANPGREVASYRCGYEQACDDMRAACLEAVLKECGVFGLGPAAREAFKDAIEGAVS